MGLLKVGKPKDWPTSKPDLRYIRNAGVDQFVHTYRRVKDLKGDDLLWGDEVEYGIFNVSENSLRLALRGREIMDQVRTGLTVEATRRLLFLIFLRTR